MRCPDCSKFVSQEMAEPEVTDCGCGDGKVTATIRICAQCAECGTNLKEATFDCAELEVPDFCIEPSHDQNIDTVDLENTDRSEGAGRYRKTFYGAEGTFHVSCSCGKKGQVDFKDEIAASGMEELV